MTASTAVGDCFAELYGRMPDGTWAAPGRVNLIGEHTDYNDGFVLPFALAERTYVAAARRDDGMVRPQSLQGDGDPVSLEITALQPGGEEHWSSYALGVVWALREAGHDVAGVDLLVDGQVPLGSGLSSSAALECAVGLAVAELHGLTLPPVELAQLARRAENDYVGVPCGVMDQMASVASTAGHALFLDTRTLATEHVPLDVEAAGLRLLVIDTRVRHSLGDGAYADRRATCEAAADMLGVPALRDVTVDALPDALARLEDSVQQRRVRHVVSENARVLASIEALRRGAWDEVGRQMVASHESLRDDYAVSCDELDVAVGSALSAGALGARMTGGGFGGCAIALVPGERVDAVTAAVEQAFAGRGFAAPRCFTVTPSEGAARIS